MNFKITKPACYKASIACLAITSLISLTSYLIETKPITQKALVVQQQVLEFNRKAISNWWTSEVDNIRANLGNPKIISRSLLILRSKRQSRSNYKSPLSIDLSNSLSKFSANRNSVSLLTKGGIVVFSTDRNKLGRYQPLNNTTTSIDLDELQTTPLNLFIDSDSGKPAISLAIPIKDEDQKRQGFLAIDLNLDRLNEQVQDDKQRRSDAQKSPTRIQAYLAARTTLKHVTYIAPPSSLAPFAAKTYPFQPLKSVGIANALDGRPGQGLYLNPNAQPTVGVYDYLPIFRTALLVESLQNDLYMPARKQASIFFYNGIIASIALFIAGYLVPRASNDTTIQT
jgi:hypothetical protein